MTHTQELAAALESLIDISAKMLDGNEDARIALAKFNVCHEESKAALSRYHAAEAEGELPVTGEWLLSIGGIPGKFPDDILVGPILRGIIRNAQSPSNGQWHWAVRSYPISFGSEPTTRSQFRSLCHALGITLKDTTGGTHDAN